MTSRRDFLIKAIGGTAAAGLLKKSGFSLNAQDKKNFQPIIRTLGRTGLKIPVVSMGVMNADNPALVKRSFEMGIRHFDTAWGYQKGRNEEMVGNVFKELNARDQVIIATKVPPGKPELMDQMGDKLIEAEFLARFEQSLLRLQTDYVDILYIHNVSDAAMLKRPGLLNAIEKVRKTKKARFVGFSTHRNMSECIAAAIPAGHFDVILTAINYSMYDDSALLAVMARAAKAGIGLVAMKTQCKQAWYREAMPDGIKKFYEGTIWHGALLKWALRLESVTTAIPGYTSFEQLETDWPVSFNLDYTPDEVKFLADRNVRLALGNVCRQCGGCSGSCPHGVDVPALVRAHMYAADYGNFHELRRALDEIPVQQGLRACMDCGTCRAVCVRGVRIARRLEELKTIFA
ncbi:MAG: aldo/keto reductase [Candidatus Aminicenantes bacterium]|nr:aldo/keto reductase [Candidatus Aminicenantes bacterium]